MNLLFICSRNKRRSLTAETVFKNNGIHRVWSAGTEPAARVRVTAKQLQAADVVLVMERKHKEILLRDYADILAEKEVVVLDIPDEYAYMDEELVLMLETIMAPYFE